jgi:Uma2 family endonuclease
MSDKRRPSSMTMAEYLAWEERQPGKHEFVDGQPVAMAGASKRHNSIAGNVLAALHGKLRGKPCRPFGSDTKLISPTGRARYPDVQVDCARLSSMEVASTDPRVVIEVLSPSNDWIDIAKLREDYQAHASVSHILFISSSRARAQAFTRDGAGWREAVLEGLSDGFDLAAIETRLEMAEIYEGVELDEMGEG